LGQHDGYQVNFWDGYYYFSSIDDPKA